MSSKNVCKYEKYGHCKSKKDCRDHHPTEICKEPVCNVAKCAKRHPQPCRYYKAGNCRFNEFCKYDHEEQINTKELFEKIRNLENEKKKILEMYDHLNTRLSNLENGGQNEDNKKEANIDEDSKLDEDTQVNDDQSVSANETRKRKFQTEDVSNKPSKTLTQSKSKMLKKEIDVYTDTLKSLRNFKLKLRIIKKEDYIFGFKKTVKSKFEALENDCSDSSRCLLEHIEETTDKWTSYSTKKYNTNVEKDIDGMIRDIKTAMEVKMIESGQKLNI